MHYNGSQRIESMRIHYFRTEITDSPHDISDLLDKINRLPRAARERRIHSKDVFLERSAQKNGMYEMEFTQRRIRNGPGYSEKGQPTADFALGPLAGFGEQAAAIWSPQGYLAVQYNHHGVRPAGIRDYLEGFLRLLPSNPARPPSLAFEPVLDPIVFVKLAKSRTKMRLECAIAADAITEGMAEGNVALGAALKLHNQTSAARVEISVSLGEGKRGGSLRNVPSLIGPLIQRAECLSKLRVKVKPDLDATTEVLDLLEHRETATVPDSSLQTTAGRRFTYSSRIEAIRREFEPWLAGRAVGH